MNAPTLPPTPGFNELVVPGAVEQLGQALGSGHPLTRVHELAGLGGFERLRDFDVPERELPLVAADTAARCWSGGQSAPRVLR